MSEQVENKVRDTEMCDCIVGIPDELVDDILSSDKSIKEILLVFIAANMRRKFCKEIDKEFHELMYGKPGEKKPVGIINF